MGGQAGVVDVAAVVLHQQLCHTETKRSCEVDGSYINHLKYFFADYDYKLFNLCRIADVNLGTFPSTFSGAKGLFADS